jgi:uncharacterized hydrophobic protein (TIGR00271 family)
MESKRTILYLYDPTAEAYVETLLASIPEAGVVRHALPEGETGDRLPLDGVDHLLVSGTYESLRRVMALAHHQGYSLGILPLPDQTRLARILALPKDPSARFSLASQPAQKQVDLLYCNDTLVLSDIRIGDTAILKRYEFDIDREGMWHRLRRRFFSREKSAPLRHHIFTVRTEKEETITLSSIGLIGLSYNNHSWVATALQKELSAADGQLALIVLAPTSLFELFIAYPIRLLWRRWQHEASLPGSWGYLKSSRFEIKSPEAQEVLIDDGHRDQTPVTLRVEAEALKLSVGASFWEKQNVGKSTRNAVRLDGIPRDEESIEYLSRGLPLFAHASRERYMALFTTLRDEARISTAYIILLILSSVIATLGLFINSGSVIIGAMLLAPLMQPIVSLSMGVLRQDSNLMLNGAKAVAVGVGLVLLSAMMIAQLTPMHDLGSEMAARLSPTILDMLVAIASGVAAAYAKNNPKISGSLVGVAIAVALVPPLAVSGIGIGWGSFGIFSNAMLLFLTNLVGIIFAAALTFFVQGFSPIRVARRGMVIWSIAALLVAVPLYRSFETMKNTSQIRRILSNLHFQLDGNMLRLSRIEYTPNGKRPQVRCEVIVDRKIGPKERTYLKGMIEKVVGRPTEVIATIRYRL